MVWEGAKHQGDFQQFVATATAASKKTLGWTRRQNNNSAISSHFNLMYNSLPTFICMTTTWKCLVSIFMEDVNKLRRNFLSLSDLEYGSQEFNSRRVRLLAKWVTWNNRDEGWKDANILFKGLYPIFKARTSASERRSRTFSLSIGGFRVEFTVNDKSEFALRDQVFPQLLLYCSLLLPPKLVAPRYFCL